MSFILDVKKTAQWLLAMHLALNVGTIRAEDSKEKKDLTSFINEDPNRVLSVLDAIRVLQAQLGVDVRTLDRAALIEELKIADKEISEKKSILADQKTGKAVSVLLAVLGGAGFVAGGTVAGNYVDVPGQSKKLTKYAKVAVYSALAEAVGVVGFQIFDNHAKLSKLDLEKMEARRLELLSQLDKLKSEVLQLQNVKSAVSGVVVDESTH